MTLLFMLAGAAVVAGLVALVVFLRGSHVPTEAEQLVRPPTRPELLARNLAGRRLQLCVALVGAVGAWLYSGILLTPILVVALVFVIPWLFDATRSHTGRIERMEALAEWTQRLADVLLLGVGLEQAIISSRRTVPAALEQPIDELVGRLQSRWRPADALRALADTLDDSTADKVLAALVLRASDRGPGLAGALADLADSVREEVRQRRAIEADRAKHRATVRWLVVIVIGVVVVGSFDRSYVAPYNSVLGLVVLVAVGMAFVGVVAWMRSLASHTPTPRFLERDRRSRTGSAPDPVQEPEFDPTVPDPGPVPGAARAPFDTTKGRR
ncbi:type II secretion system F family protein [Streptacidiphilus cavernicola]|uniref:Type II secretion system F family protein n=1 Tax=Streptacidiphilus cavernicola TaxID=3342716 RepID=A0ABV6W0P6_9ACTN